MWVPHVQTRGGVKSDCRAGGKRGDGKFYKSVLFTMRVERSVRRPHSLPSSIAAVIQRIRAKWGKKRKKLMGVR